jgi:hypothetical protein
VKGSGAMRRWVRTISTLQLLCIGEAMRVPVGAVWRDTVRLDAVPAGVRRPGVPVGGFYTRPIEGRYRLAWGIYDPAPASPDRIVMGPPGPLRAESERTSNAFEIVATPVAADYLEASVTRSRGKLGERREWVRLWREAGAVRAERGTRGPRSDGVERVTRLARPEAQLRDLLLRLDSLSRHVAQVLVRPSSAPPDRQCRDDEPNYGLLVRDGSATRGVFPGCAALPDAARAHRDAFVRIFDELAKS